MWITIYTTGLGAAPSIQAISQAAWVQVWVLHEKSLNRVPVEKKQQRKLNQQMMKQQQLNDEVEGKRELGAENGISL